MEGTYKFDIQQEKFYSKKSLMLSYLQRRKNTVMTDYKNILKALKEKDPANSSSINFVKDLSKFCKCTCEENE